MEVVELIKAAYGELEMYFFAGGGIRFGKSRPVSDMARRVRGLGPGELCVEDGGVVDRSGKPCDRW